MRAHNTAPALSYRRPGRQQVLVAALQDKRKSLVGNFQQSRGARHASISGFEGLLDQVCFVAQNFFIKGAARKGLHWHRFLISFFQVRANSKRPASALT